MNGEARILVLAPHADDEAVGCGGSIAKAAAAGAVVKVVYGGVGGLLHRHLSRPATYQERCAEIRQSCDILGVHDWFVMYPQMDMKLDTIPQLDLVSRLDRVLDAGFDEVYIPYPGHNHDHRAMHQAAVAALRPGAHPGVKLIAMYEYVYPGWAQWTAPGGRLYVDISQFIETKLAAVEAYVSQAKSGPSPLSADGVRALATLRGLEVCVDHAELFHVLQLVR
jgi:LmbE family N-acetylglucosaminyl deacetylase